MSNAFLTPDAIAQVMETTPHTVRRLIRSGEIKSFRMGGQYRVRLEDFAEYLAGTANFPIDAKEVQHSLGKIEGLNYTTWKGAEDGK